jgi:uncharacterized protein (DUF1800 family)
MPFLAIPFNRISSLRLPSQARKSTLRACLLSLSVLLASCGGGGGGGDAPQTAGAPPTEQLLSAEQRPASSADAHRFLIQATFGPTPQEVARVQDIGYGAWIDEQFDLASTLPSHVQTVEASSVALGASRAFPVDVVYSWWTHAVKDPAQLRQRVAFALSEIFVVSTLQLDEGRNIASYMDMLYQNADANYRDLLEAVAMHPAMGQYLSHLGNRKEDAASGRVPDENFAREVMQLFSIGLYELEDSGKPKLVNGAPVETYSDADIKGMAKVFTGFSWFKPASKSSLVWWQCFWFTNECDDPSRNVTAMSHYASEHSTSIKQLLGVTIPVQTVADPRASLKAALDRLATHPNTAPFISRQLIQRLITSNPSDAYVADITGVFRAQHGNLRAVVKAILLHEEARSPAAPSLSGYGKLREPLVRYVHLLRAIPHLSDSYAARAGNGQVPFYRVGDTSDPGFALAQTPMRAPSVFNYFRPGYTPPQTAIADAGLVAPEMQITNETSVLGYANFVTTTLEFGWGDWNSTLNRPDIAFDLSTWNALVSSPAQLVDAIANRLVGRPLTEDARQEAIAAVTDMPSSTTHQKRRRIQAAILLTAVSPDFLVQQ